jgi:hypothetical protein
VIDVSRVEEFPHQGTLFGGSGDGRKELEERFSVAFPGELLERPGEGLVAYFFCPLQARRVGGQKGEGKLGILLVLRKMKANASYLPPERRAFNQESLEPSGGGGLAEQPGIERDPQALEAFGGEILGPFHRWSCLEKTVGLFEGEWVETLQNGLPDGTVTAFGEIARNKVSPVGKQGG